MDYGDVQHGLLLAARSGNLQSLDSILGSYPGLDVNFVDEGGLTPLIHCIVGSAEADGQHAECCQVLLDVGASSAFADATEGRTAVHWAIAVEREDIVSQLIATGADPTQNDFHNNNAVDLAVQQRPPRCLAVLIANLHSDLLQIVDAKGLTSLIKAIQKGNIEAVGMLLNSNVEVNVKTGSHGWTPVHWACHADQSDILSLLLQSGADASVTDMEQKTAGHIAAINENPDCINVLIKQCGIEAVQTADQQGVTPLMYSCGVGNDRHVKVMLKKKVDVSAVDIDGQSALHWCKENRHARCVDLLCKRHPEILNQPDAQSQTALHHAAIAGNAVVCIALCQQPGIQKDCLDNEQHTPVHWASVSGHVDVLMCLAECGASLSSPDVNGAHALHYAVQLCSTAVSAGEMNEDIMVRGMECIRVLLDKGCQVDVKDNEERTPLMWAAAADGMSNVCALLSQHGADVNAHDNLGMTPLHIAVNTFHPTECVTLVSELGADVNAVDHNEHSPLFIAVSQNATDMVAFLLQSGATPDKQDKDKMSVAHIASSLGYLDCLDLIHSHIGHIDLKNDRGARPLHEAAGNGHIGCVEFLLKAGCSVDSSDNDGATSLHFAAAGNHVEVCSLLINAKADVNAIVTTDQGVVLTPLDFAEASGAFDALQEIQSAGGAFGRQTRRMDAIKQEKEVKVVGKSDTLDVKPEEEEPEGKEQVKETEMAVEGGTGETEREKCEVILKSKQEADEEPHKPEMKREESIEQMCTDVKEDDVMDKLPDGDDSQTAIKIIRKEPPKEGMAENKTDSKEETGTLYGDNVKMREHKESEGQEQLETRKLEQSEGREEEKTVNREEMEVKLQCDSVQENKNSVEMDGNENDDRGVDDVELRDDEQKTEAPTEEAAVAVAGETEIPPVLEETRDRDSESSKGANEEQKTEGREETAVAVVGQMEIPPALEETEDSKLSERADEEDTTGDVMTPTLSQPPDQTDVASGPQAPVPGSEAGQLSSHRAAPPPTPPTPSKKRRHWLFKSSATSPQEQKQTESPTLKRPFNFRRLSKADSPSKAANVENPVMYACAYGALVSGVVGGITPQQYIVQQLVTTLPQLKTVPDETRDNTPVKVTESTVVEEIVVSQTDASRPTPSSSVEENGVEESPVVASPTVAPLSDTSESVAKREEVNMELAREVEPQESDNKIQATESDSPRGRKQPELDSMDAKEGTLEIPTAESRLEQETTTSKIDVLSELDTMDAKEVKLEIPTAYSKLKQHQEQPLVAEQQYVAIRSRPIVMEIRQHLKGTDKPIQPVVSDTDRIPSPMSSQPDRSVSEKSLGSLIDAVAMQIDERVAGMPDTGGQVEADEEQEKQQKPDFLSDEEKRLIESLKLEQERPRSAAACAMKELARAHALQFRMIRSVEQAKLELKCSEKAQKAALQDEKASLRARAEQKKYEDWLKKLDRQSKMVTDSIGKNTAEAALKNEQLNVVLAECGGIKRPTVAQWLQNKLQQQQSRMQEELIYLDRTKSQRQGMVTAEKQVAQFRADRHQGWEKQKQLQDQIKNVKRKHEELISTAFAFPARPMRNPYIYDVNRTQSKNSQNGLPSVLGSGRLTSQQTVFQKKTYSVPIKGREFEEKSSTQGGKGKDRKAQGIPKPASIKITTVGFEKSREEKEQTRQQKPTDRFDVGSEELWELGEKILNGSVGHSSGLSGRQRNRLQFVSPDHYTPLVSARPSSANDRHYLSSRAMERLRERPTSAG